MQSGPSIVRAPEGKGLAERVIRTLKERLRWVQTFATVEQLRRGLGRPLQSRVAHRTTRLQAAGGSAPGVLCGPRATCRVIRRSDYQSTVQEILDRHLDSRAGAMRGLKPDLPGLISIFFATLLS